jgi:formate hydrogenlyase subunit 6/NADH:ubiquinone oxidoreductase subunit I
MVSPIPKVDEELCTRCGLCVEACICECLQMGDQGSVPHCSSESSSACMLDIRCDCLCEEVCPTGAIQCSYEIVLEDGPGASCGSQEQVAARRRTAREP